MLSRGLKGTRDSQQLEITPRFAHNLHPNGQAIFAEAPGYRYGWQSGDRNHAAYGHPVDIRGHVDPVDFADPIKIGVKGGTWAEGIISAS